MDFIYTYNLTLTIQLLSPEDEHSAPAPFFFYEALLPFIIRHNAPAWSFSAAEASFWLHNQKTAGTCFFPFISNILSTTSNASFYKCEKYLLILQNISKPLRLTPQSDNMNMKSITRSVSDSKMCFSSFVVRSATGMNYMWICKEKSNN